MKQPGGVASAFRAEPRAVRRGILVLSAAVLIADLLLPPLVAVDALYILPVLASVFLADRSASLWTAAGVTGLSLAASALELRGAAAGTVLGNGAIALCAVWVTAGLVTLRKTSEAELLKSRRQTHTTLESIRDGVITVDGRDRIVFLNRAAEVLTGWREADALGRPLTEVFRLAAAGKDGAAEWSSAEGLPRQSGGFLPYRGERTLIGRDGTRREVEATSAPLSDPEGGPGPGLDGRVLVFRDVTERRRQEEVIEALAYRDALTELPNRTSFLDRLELELAHARRRGTNLALLFLDLDRFKQVNDTLGHAAGDRLLFELARRLREVVRAADTVARLAGDEFTIVLPDVGTRDDARHVAKKVAARLARPYELEGHEVVCTPSIGLALYPEDGENVDKLLRAADRDMYAAKHARRRRRSAPPEKSGERTLGG